MPKVTKFGRIVSYQLPLIKSCDPFIALSRHDLFPPNGRIPSFFSWKILEVLAINHSASERRDIFVPELLKLSHAVVVLQFAWVRRVHVA